MHACSLSLVRHPFSVLSRSRARHVVGEALLGAAGLALLLSPAPALAAAIPQIVISEAPVATPLYGEPATLNLSFDNVSVPGDVGYNPVIELVFPAEVVTVGPLVSAVFGNIAGSSQVVPISGSLSNPISGEVLSGLTPGSTYVVYEIPIGSTTPEQPALNFSVSVDLDPLHPPQSSVSDLVVAIGLWSLGGDPLDNPLVDPVIRNDATAQGISVVPAANLQGAAASTDIVPQVYIPSKILSEIDGNGTATGPNFPVAYTLEADIADQITLTPFTFSETIPDDLRFTGLTALSVNASSGDPNVTVEFERYPCGSGTITLFGPAPLSTMVFPVVHPDGTADITPPPGDVPGGCLRVIFDALAGESISNDVDIYYDAYVPKFDAIGNLIIPSATGGVRLVSNTVTTSVVNAAGAYGNLSLVGQDITTPAAASAGTSLDTQKGIVILVDNGPAGASPGDIVQFAISGQVSDYFAHDQIALHDTLGDGFDFNILNPGNPRLVLGRENGNTLATTPLPLSIVNVDPAPDSSLPGQEYPFPAAATLLLTQNARPGEASGNSPGFTTLVFDISNFLGHECSVSGSACTVDADCPGAEVCVLSGEMEGGFIDLSSAATGFRTGIDDDTRFSVTFEATIQEAYENPASFSEDASIDAGDSLGNTEITSGNITSDPGGQFDTGTSPDSAGISIDTPTLTKTLVAINGNATLPVPLQVKRGDDVTYALEITIPAGDLESLRLLDFLPLPAFDVADPDADTVPSGWTFDNIIYPAGSFPAAGVASFGPNTSNVPPDYDPLANPPAIIVDTVANSLEFAFPNLITFEPAVPQQLVVQVYLTVTVTNDPFADRLFLANFARAIFGNSNANLEVGDVAPLFLIRSPVLALTKGVSATNQAGVIAPPPATLPVDGDLSGADAADTVTYVITVENTGGSEAFDVTVIDPEVAGMSAGSCVVLSVTQGDGVTPLAYSGDLFAAGLLLTNPLAVNDENPAGGGAPFSSDTALITVSCVNDATVEPLSSFANTASVTNFASASGGANFVPVSPPGTFSDTASVGIAAPAVVKVVESVSPGPGAAGEIAAGDTVVYAITATLPEGQTNSLVITDTLPPGLVFQAPAAVDTAGPGFAGVLPAPVTTVTGTPAAGQVVALNFGTATVSGDNNAGSNSFIVRITALVDGSYVQNDGLPAAQAKLNSVSLAYATGPDLNDTASVSFVEPALVISKQMTPPTADAGDQITITLTVDNNGTAPAFDVAISDVLDGALFDLTPLVSVNEGVTPPDFTYSYDAVDTVSYVIDAAASIAAGGSRVFTFSANVRNDVVTSTTYSNSAGVSGDSQDGVVTGERSSSASGGDTVGVLQSGVAKSLTATFENSTDPTDANLGANPPLAVGERLTYQIVFTVPEGLTNAVRLADVLPAGIEHIPGSASLTRSSVALLAANDPGSINSAAPGVPVAVALSGVSGEILVDLGNVSNLDINNGVAETYTLTLDALVENIASNSAGQNLDNRGRVRFQDAFGTELFVNSPVVRIHVAEAVPTVAKTALPASANGGDTVTFTLLITNNSSGANAAPAFDWTFTDVLPAEYITPALLSVDVSNAPGAIASAAFLPPPNDNELNGVIDQLDPGEYVTVTYTAIIDPATPFATTITNTASIDSSSLPGPNGSGASNPNPPGAPNGERNGSGGVNDLFASSIANVSVNAPSLTKTLLAPQSYYAIGEAATFQISVGVPIGSSAAFAITDIIDANISFVPGSLAVVTPAGFSGSNTPFNEGNAAFFNQAANTLTFDFGAITATAAGNITVTYDVLVDNLAANQNNVTRSNSATLDYEDPSNPGSTLSEGPVNATLTIGEPNLDMLKEIVSGAVGSQAGDTVRWGVEIGNDLASSNTTAYGVVWADILPDGGGGAGAADGLEQISNVAVSIAGGNVFRAGTAVPVTAADAVISTSLNTNDSIAFNPMDIEPGARIRIEFDSIVGANAVQGASLNNVTSAVYNSLSGGGGRDDSSGPAVDDDNDADLNNYQEGASQGLILDTPIAIDKTVAVPSYTIGQDVTYTIRVALFEGVTQSVFVTDELPPGLLYQSHNIALGNMGISLGNPAYNTPSFGIGGGGGTTVTFDFGDIGNAPNADPADDYIDIEIAARVENIAGNQNGDVLSNNTFLLYGPGATRIDFDSDAGTPGVQGLDVNVVEPELTVTKTALPSSQALGDLVTFTVTVSHIGATSSADAYDLVITDTIPAGLTYVPGSASPPPADVSFVDPVLTVLRSSLTLADGSFVFTYQATVDTDAAVGVPLVNALDVVWASIPGATGAPDNGRDGSGGVNDYLVSDNSPVTPSTAAFVDAQKTVILANDADLSGTVTPGDTLHYDVVLANNSVNVTSLVFSDTIPAQTTYVAASLSTDLGVADDSAAPLLVVNVGGMVAGATVNIGFDVTVDAGTAAGTVISNQGSIDSDQTVPEPTDEDGLDGNGDQPTDVIVGAPPSVVNELYVNKFVSLQTDADASGSVTPGDTLRYLLIFYNQGSQVLTNVALADNIPGGLTGLVASGVVTGAGSSITVTAATVAVSIPTIASGDFEAAQFDVTVDGPPLYDGSGDGDPTAETFTNQGAVDSDQTTPGLTDGNSDPSDGNQPSSIDAVDGVPGAPAIDVEKRVSLALDNDGDGLVDPLDVLEYTITLINSGSADAVNVQLSDNPMPNDTTVVAGSASSSQGFVISESPLLVNIGNMGPGAVVVVSFRVTVDAGTPNGTIIVNQASATGDNFAAEDSDDNGNDGDGKNPNLTPVDTGAPGGGGPGDPDLAKSVSASSEAGSATPEVLIGELVTFRLQLGLPAGTTREVTLSDTLPAGMTYVAGSARLARNFDTALSSSANPGSINSAASGVFVALADGSDFVAAGQALSVFLGDVINSDNDADAETYFLEYQAYIDNVAGNQRAGLLVNAGQLDYLDALLQPQTLGDSVSLTVTEPELAIAKVALPATTNPFADTVSFTLTISSSSAASTATGYDVRILDTLPAVFSNLSVVTVTPSAGISGVTDNSAGSTVDITVAVFPPGEQLLLDFTADVLPPFSGQNHVNTATVTWSSLPGDNGSGNANPNAPGTSNGERNGSGGVNDHSSADTASIETPVLFLAKSDNPDPVEPGALLTYTLDYASAASVTLTNAVIVETYDARVSFVSAIPAPDVGDNQWNLGDLAPGQFGSIEITVLVDAGLSGGELLANDAVLSVDGGVSVNENETTPVVVVDPATAYLELNKTASQTVAPSGSQMVYTLEIVNNGPATSFDTVVSDTLPLGISFSSSVPAPDVSAAPLYQWNIGDLAAGASTTIDITVDVEATAPLGLLLDNCATALGDDTPGGGAPSATYLAEGCVVLPASGPADVEISKSDLADPVIMTSDFSYELTVNSLGPGLATNVVVVDTLPAGISYVSDTGGCVEAPAGTLTCALGDMAAGSSTTFQVSVNVTTSAATAGTLQTGPCDGSEDLCNLAVVSAAPLDPDGGNNSDDEPTNVLPMADVQIGKVDPPEPIPAGTAMTYTLRVRNNGTSDADNVVVTDTLDAWTAYLSDDSGCVQAPAGTVTCSLGTMTAGELRLIALTVQINAGAPITSNKKVGACDGTEDICNAVSVASDTDDLIPGNDSDDEPTDLSVAPPIADLQISKTDAVDPIQAGGVETYTLTVVNNGPFTATDVIVTDTLDANSSYVADTAGCTESPLGTLTCNLGTLAVGESYSFNISVAVGAGAPTAGTNNGTVCDGSEDLCNSALVTSSTADDDPTNNSAEQATDVVPATSSANLSIVKIDTTAEPVAPGANVDYLITVTNNGPDAAIDVVVTDTMGVDLSYVSDSGGCVESPTNVLTCNLGVVPAFTSVNFTVTANVSLGAAISGTVQDGDCGGLEDTCNSASVSASSADVDGSDNADSEPTDISPNLLCGNGVVNPGEDCEPPSAEICNNGVDDNGDALIDCADPLCPAGSNSCDANCLFTNPCVSILNDPAIIRTYGEQKRGRPRKDFVKIHGRFIPNSPVDPYLEGFSFLLTNADGIIYTASLFPGDFEIKREEFRFKDKRAKRTGLGIRGGIFKLRVKQRFDGGFLGYGFTIKAYGDLSRAVLPRMTTQVYIGDDVAFLTATWRGDSRKWKLKQSDF